MPANLFINFVLFLISINNNRMNVLITGGAGYIGNELILKLTVNPQVRKIIVYDNLSRRNYNLFLDKRIDREKLQFVNGDLLDSRRIRKEMDGIYAVYHLAGMNTSPITKENTHLFEQINQWGTSELVHSLKGSQVKKFIYMSSDAVYGFSDHPITTESPLQPVTLFAKSKLKGEKIVEPLMNIMETIIVRSATVYGYSPGVRFESLINRFMFEVNFIGRIRISGNGNQVRSFIHVEQAANFLDNLITANPALESGIYNLAGKNISVADIASTLKEIYPFMDVSFSDEDQPVKNRVLASDQRISHLITLPPQSLKDELESFKNQFSFSPEPAFHSYIH
jgi:UDP-glucose 4-epimerase